MMTIIITNVIGYLYKGKNRRVAIFDIRKIDNNSSSKMGIAIAVSGDNNLTEAEIGNHTYTYMPNFRNKAHNFNFQRFLKFVVE